MNNCLNTNTQEIAVDQNVIDHAEKHGKKSAYLYNNRLFMNVINPSNPELHRKQYNANWMYLKSLPDNILAKSK